MKISLWLIALLTLPLSSLPSQAAVNIQSQSSVSESTLNTLDFPSNQLLAKRIPKIGIVSNRVKPILSNFKPRTYKFGSQQYSFGPNDMRHILTRHHPKYWNGKKRPVQSFFNRNMTVSDINNGIDAVIKQNSSKINTWKPEDKMIQLTGFYKGVKYRVGFDRLTKRIHQFYPVVK